MRTAYVVGGDVGLGRELVNPLASWGYDVEIDATWTAVFEERKTRTDGREMFRSLSAGPLANLEELVASMPHLDLLVWAATYYPSDTTKGRRDEFDSLMMFGLTSPIYLVNEVLAKQGTLSGLLMVNLPTPYVPSMTTPEYKAASMGLEAYAVALSLTHQVKKTMVVRPEPSFRNDGDRGVESDILDVSWAAEDVLTEFFTRTGCAYEGVRLQGDKHTLVRREW